MYYKKKKISKSYQNESLSSPSPPISVTIHPSPLSSPNSNFNNNNNNVDNIDKSSNNNHHHNNINNINNSNENNINNINNIHSNNNNNHNNNNNINNINNINNVNNINNNISNTNYNNNINNNDDSNGMDTSSDNNNKEINPVKDNNKHDNNNKQIKIIKDKINDSKIIEFLNQLNKEDLSKYYSILERLYYNFYYLEIIDLCSYSYNADISSLFKNIITHCQKCSFFLNFCYFAKDLDKFYDREEVFIRFAKILDHCINPNSFDSLKDFLLKLFTINYFKNKMTLDFLDTLLKKTHGKLESTKQFLYDQAQDFIDIVKNKRFELIDEIDDGFKELHIINSLTLFFNSIYNQIIQFFPTPMLDRISNCRDINGFDFGKIKFYDIDKVTSKYWFFDDVENSDLIKYNNDRNNKAIVKINHYEYSESELELELLAQLELSPPPKQKQIELLQHQVQHNNKAPQPELSPQQNSKSFQKNSKSPQQQQQHQSINNNNNNSNINKSNSSNNNDSSIGSKKNSNDIINNTWKKNEIILLVKGFYMYDNDIELIKKSFFSGASEYNSNKEYSRSINEVKFKLERYKKEFRDKELLFEKYLSNEDKEWCDKIIGNDKEKAAKAIQFDESIPLSNNKLSSEEISTINEFMNIASDENFEIIFEKRRVINKSNCVSGNSTLTSISTPINPDSILAPNLNSLESKSNSKSKPSDSDVVIVIDSDNEDNSESTNNISKSSKSQTPDSKASSNKNNSNNNNHGSNKKKRDRDTNGNSKKKKGSLDDSEEERERERERKEEKKKARLEDKKKTIPQETQINK